jgi:hypothetical protein
MPSSARVLCQRGPPWRQNKVHGLPPRQYRTELPKHCNMNKDSHA